MSSLLHDLATTLSRVDPQTALLLERAVRDSLALAEQRQRSLPQPCDSLGYPIGYFDSTSGSFSAEPLDRQTDLPAQARESW